MMHTGTIDTDFTAAGRVYTYLRRSSGKWIDSWRLTLDTKTTAISTRISEVRHQLGPSERIEVKQEGRKFFYRLAKVERVTAPFEAIGLGL